MVRDARSLIPILNFIEPAPPGPPPRPGLNGRNRHIVGCRPDFLFEYAVLFISDA